MPQSNRGEKIAILLRWPLGLGLVFWRYLWRTVPMHRAEEDGGPADLPPELPVELLDDKVQRLADGTGPLLHRRYRVRIEDTAMTPEDLLGAIAANPNVAAPSEFAVFRKISGKRGSLRIGDEFVVRMPGPWDGPVRVVLADPTVFRLATLRGHLEAGQIEFRARRENAALAFEIESWARSGDRLSDLLYNGVGLAKEVQVAMWAHVCLRAAELANGRVAGGIDIHTRRLESVRIAGDDAIRP